MESSEDRQQLEITALKSIYDENFLDCPPPKAWKGAPRFNEFILRVRHRDEEHGSNIYFHLYVKFPKTYPTLAIPIFQIRQPTAGLKPPHVEKLTSILNHEAQKLKGTESVFQAVEAAQDWLENNVSPAIEPSGSLATQMTQRALEEEQARRLREEAQAEEEYERQAKQALELEEQIRADAQYQQLERERLYQSRKRASSDATEVPLSSVDSAAPTEWFGTTISWRGALFSKVQLFHPEKDGLGTLWQAEPITEDGIRITLPLQLYTVTFNARYYSTTQGRKKLKLLENDIQRLTKIRHENLLEILAVKTDMPQTNKPPRLLILCERRPAMTLQAVLDDCDSLREERASEYLLQILHGLDALHSTDVVHRGLSLRCVGLTVSDRQNNSKRIKIFNTGYHVRLSDMNRSEPFCKDLEAQLEPTLPDGWLSKEVLESPLEYTKARDLHNVGVILLQMLLGRDVIDNYPDFQTALSTAALSRTMQRHASNMLTPARKHVTAHTLLADMAGDAFGDAFLTPVIDINGNGPKTPTWQGTSSSPDSIDYFKGMPIRTRSHVSRWKEDWEELELLGRGAFGSVVKARNKIDNRIYAVKKIRLRTNQSDQKIFREVTALARLYHRNIVRYYTTWVETSENASSVTSTVGSSAGTSVPGNRSATRSSVDGESDSDPFVIDLNELNSNPTEDRHSFPSIHFTRSATPESSESEPSDEFDEGILFDRNHDRKLFKKASTPVPTVTRILYIQMEFVERQTLRERIAEGLTEEEAWRLFQQIVDALVHMSSMNILHRDIKLTNIFIDSKGDCKIGDFGLATSSLAAVDPSDVSSNYVADADMTLDVGTRLYIAPEVQSSHRKPRGQNHAKADMYSLGIVFFEMNHAFSTGAERIAVLEGLRKPTIMFPSTWDPRRSRQQQIIIKLLNHDPDQRPSALELSQDPLLPARIEDEYYMDILKKMAEPNSAYHQSVLNTLFSQRTKLSRAFLYDSEEVPEHATLNGIVHDRIVQIFRLHGAVDMEPPLLMPVTNPIDDGSRAMFLDRNGEVVALPNNAFSPFARLAARLNIRRIKRYHVCDIYKPDLIAGHPKASKTAIFDIISQDMQTGPSAAAAEAIAVVNECLESFVNLDKYEIHISHTKIFDAIFDSIPEEQRAEIVKILAHSDASRAQRRSLLTQKGLTRTQIDALEVLGEPDSDVDGVLSRLEKVLPQVVPSISDAVREVKNTIEFAIATGVTRQILFHALFMIRNPVHYFNGLCFQIARRQPKRPDILAIGGRYDHMINHYSPSKVRDDGICAVAVQIAFEKITVALASYQSASLRTILKERRSYGYWSPRRCDVYVVSHQEGGLSERLEVTSLLWKHNISADMMYEFGMLNIEHENVVEQCSREGILFIVYPRPRTARREQAAFRVKSVLRGTEDEVSKQELVPYLLQQVSEQRRLDATLSGAPSVSEGTQALGGPKEISTPPDISLIVSGDVKKRKATRQLYMDRAFDFGADLRNAVMQSSIATIGIDVPPNVFNEMKSTDWITDDDAFKVVVAGFPTPQPAYVNQIREAVLKRKAAGAKFAILFAVREEQGFVLRL